MADCNVRDTALDRTALVIARGAKIPEILRSDALFLNFPHPLDQTPAA